MIAIFICCSNEKCDKHLFFIKKKTKEKKERKPQKAKSTKIINGELLDFDFGGTISYKVWCIMLPYKCHIHTLTAFLVSLCYKSGTVCMWTMLKNDFLFAPTLFHPGFQKHPLFCFCTPPSLLVFVWDMVRFQTSS